ncbi:MAG: hypothetical protein HY272_14700 [Gammaproteobacteria bacterium]|nr:hypothetical protein [Gammaproteobacteria bacterium]
METAARVFSTVTADQAEVPQQQPLSMTHLGHFIDDALLLGCYALNAGILSDPKILERLVILQRKMSAQDLTDADIAELIQSYDYVNNITGEVTPDSIRLTDDVRESGYLRSTIGRHLLRLWGLTLLVGALIFGYAMLQYRVSYFDLGADAQITEAHLFWVRLQNYLGFLVPFTYGALGTCAYLLRVVEQRLKARDFDIGRIPQHWNRFVLGTLSGGMVVLFVNQLPGAENTTIKISEGALGFLAGYSIEFLFQTLDRILAAILPKKSESTNPAHDEQEKVRLILDYEQRLNASQDPTERKALMGILRDLKA